MSDTKAASAADKPRTGQPKAAGFSYAKAAQGRQTAAAQKPTAANQQAGANTNGGKAVAASAASTTSSGAATPAIKEAPAAPALASVSTTDASSPKNTEKSSTPVVSTGSNVHMPPRAQEPSTSAVQFGNFANQGQQQAQESPVPSKAQPVANPGPRTGPNKMPQFGSFENGNENKQLHSRTNSESSEFRPTNVPNFNGQNPGQGGYYGQGQPAFGYQPGYAPAMPGYRGPQRGGMQQFSAPRGHHTPGRPSQGSGNHASMASPRGNSVSSPLGTPQQQHAQMAQMNSPMGSPMYNGYTQMHAPGMYGYPGGYSPAFGQGGYPGYPGSPMQGPGTPGQGGSYINQQGRQMQYGGPQVSHGQGQGQASQGGNQYQNPNLQSPAARGSGLSDRTSSTPQPPATPTFKTPRKSAAIKIVRPDTKEEVVVPRVETRRAVPAATASPAPSSRTADRPLSSAASIGSSSTPAPATVSTPVPETPEQIKAKQDAARQAVFDKLAASRAQSEEAAAAAKKKETDAADAEQKAAEEKEKAEKEVAEKEAAEKAAAEKAAAEKAAADKAAEEQRLKAEEEAKQKVEAEAAANKAKEEAEAKAEEAQQKAAAEEAESGKAESEAAEKTKVGELSSAQSGSLDTIAEPAAEDQKADIVETKPLEDDMKKLSIDTSAKDAPSRMLECLEKAKSIASLKDISYPSGINPPSTTLNANASNGKFKYDRDFLLQFQKVYTDKPMQNWDERIKETIGDADSRSAKGGLGGRNGSRGPQSPFTPLPFSSGKPLPTSQARFDQAEKMRAQGLDPKTGLPSASRRGPEVNLGAARDLNLPRTDSKRGGKSATGGRAPSNRPEKNREGAPTIAPEDVKPLPKTKNAWVPKRGAAEQEPLPGGEDTQMPPEMVQRKVKGLLNKLTVDNFERITDQILEISSQSKNETDGRTLRQVIALTFEKATDEAHFSNMYARFCRKMMDTMDPSIGDESLKNGKGETVTGGVLFRKYLLTRCQEDFERGWKSQLPPKPEGEAQTEEAAMLSDEYYIEAAAKRRGLGLVRFVGEVYKLGMLNEKIMHQIIVKLLSNVKDPEEDEVESMTKLITTVGATFDAQERGSQYMDAYVVRMKDMAQNTKLSSRHRFMIMDVLDLRAAGWQGADTAGPKTIQAIHEEAEKAAALKEAQRGPSHRGGPPGGGGRPGFGHGDVRAGSRRQESHGPTITTSADGWSSVRAAGDLGAFGKFDRTGSKQSGFGPGGSLSQQARNTISGRSAGGSRNPSHAGNAREDSRAAPQQPANAFAVLQGDDGEPKEEEESGVATEQAEATGRPKLNILPKGATSGEEAEASPAADSGARRPLLNLLPKGATSGKEPVMAPKSSQEESPAGEAEASSNKPDADNEDD